MDGSDFANGRGDLPAWAWVRDPVFGRTVTVPDRLFAKVARDHPYLRPLSRRMVLQAVAHAHANRAGSRGSRHCYYLRGVGTSNWLCVVVEYDQNLSGEVITAYPARRLPGSLSR